MILIGNSPTFVMQTHEVEHNRSPMSTTRPEHEIIELGNYVALLFGTERFNTLWSEFETVAVASFLSTQPHESKNREGIYAKLNGARDFLMHMRGYIDARDEIIRNQDDNNAHPLEDGVTD